MAAAPSVEGSSAVVDDPRGVAHPLAEREFVPALAPPASESAPDAADALASRPSALAHASERELYAGFRRQVQAGASAIDEIAAKVLAGDGPRAQKVALLRALQDAEAPSALDWIEYAVRTLPDVGGARGESVPLSALGLMERAASRDPDARERLARLAFESPGIHVNLQRRAAEHYAMHCELTELGELRHRLYRATDDSVRAASLAALDRRANEPYLQRWLAEFEDWPRPAVRDE